jgi:hypothetical protein
MAQVLADLGVRAGLLSPEESRDLDQDGFVVFRAVAQGDWLRALQEAFERFALPGEQDPIDPEPGTRRMGNLVDKGEVFDTLWAHPKVLAAVHHVLGRPFRFSDLSGRDPLPGQGYQDLHPDDGPGPDGRCQNVKAIWMMDDFTVENGATRLVPGSHLGPDLPKERQEIQALGKAGDVLVFDAMLWHSGMKNGTDKPRRLYFPYYSARECPPLSDHKKGLSPRTLQRLSPAMRWLLDV